MKFDSPKPSDGAINGPRPSRFRTRSARSAGAVVAVGVTLLLGGLAVASDDERDADSGNGQGRAAQLRQFIDRQVGGINKLKVPANDAAIPVPFDPARPDRYTTTPEKRFLGKMLFHDPVRTARVNINTGQPLDFPAGTAFGGTLAAGARANAIADATRQTGSCGSCHIGESGGGKAGQQLNFNTGGEGRGYTDENGNFTPRRRPQAILVPLRTAPIFPGDVRVDALPTLTDIVKFGDINSPDVVTTPATFFHTPAPTFSIRSGRLDQLDSVGRMSPSMVGFAFNNRLLLGGFAGEPQSTPGSANPFSDPAQENLTLLLLDAHRMLGFQSAELQKIPAYVQLFRDAFADEARAADAKGDLNELINDVTVLRATSTFLRTVVTRNTPFDRFLAGDNRAMTNAQQRGAKLFFTPAADGAGGAGCSGCHSGPMLNKQYNDPDVAGIGAFVEENFINVGIGDHPVQALNALARGRLNPNRLGQDGFAYHSEDTGRQEITFNPNDAFKFRSLTLRQLRDGRNFFHSGAFTKVRDVVQYFNAGVPQDPTAGAAATLSTRFTYPRGNGYPRGLGLSNRQVDDLTDFLENALYDPAIVTFDPTSSTDTLQPNTRDFAYLRSRTGIAPPRMIAPGVMEGPMPSRLAIDDNDPLARRDQGLEFLDVTSQLSFRLVESDRDGRRQSDRYRITNNSTSVVDTHLLLIAKGVGNNDVRMVNASGTTSGGDPYLRVFLADGVLQPGQSIVRELKFERQAGQGQWRPRYVLNALSGQGKP